jgi:hypothetical protein
MTTKDDWRFRAEYLAEQAKHLDIKATSLQAEAVKYRELSERARKNAEASPQPT